MTEKKKATEQTPEQADPSVDAADPSVESEAPEAAADETGATEEATASGTADEDDVQRKLDEVQGRYQYLNAEFENYKKRMVRENSERLKYSNGDLIKELLPSLDNLERAIDHAKKEESSRESMIEGLEMVYKMAQESLVKFGVARIDASGQVFDPNLHQAVGMVDAGEVPENHVAEQLQAGYTLYDRVLRPSMVRVAGKA